MITVRQILQDVSRRRGVSVEQITGPSRLTEVAAARHEVMYLARCEDVRRKLEGEVRLSTPHIGRFTNRDHSTVLHGAKQHAARQGLPKPWEWAV